MQSNILFVYKTLKSKSLKHQENLTINTKRPFMRKNNRKEKHSMNDSLSYGIAM